MKRKYTLKLPRFHNQEYPGWFPLSLSQMPSQSHVSSLKYHGTLLQECLML